MSSRQLQYNIFLIILGIFTGWWFLSATFFQSAGALKEWFGISYGVMALFGGVIGLINARAWGGLTNTIGRATICFSIGLLLQVFGQIGYSYFIVFRQIQIPYPSIGDVGFFGSIPFYIYAMYLLGRAVINYGSAKSYYRHLGKALLPLVLLPISYIVFLSVRDVQATSFMATFLDFAYPFGDALYLSVAFFVYFLSRDSYLGVLKRPFLIICVALVVQSTADFMFLVQAHRDTWILGGSNDFVYFIGYAVLVFGLFRLQNVLDDTRAVVGIGGETRSFFNPMRFLKKVG